MSTDYPNIYSPISKNIYSLLDSLENKLSRHTTYSNNGVEPKINNYYYNNNNLKAEQDFNINRNMQIDYNYIKKIVINEFAQLILPYQKDLNFNVSSLESKINSINSKIDFMKENENKINNNTNKHNENFDDYVSRKEYEELQNEMSLMNSSITSLKKLIEKNYNSNNNKILQNSNNIEIKSNEKNIYEEINKIKKSISQNENMYNINPNLQLKEYDIKLNNIIQNFNTIKEENKNLNGELSQLKEQINNETQKNLNLNETSVKEVNLNELNKLNSKIKNLENNMKNIEQNCGIKLINFKKNIDDFELKLNEINAKNIGDEHMSIKNSNLASSNNEKNNQIIEEIIQKKFDDLNLENNKYFKDLLVKYDSKNEQIFKLFEEHNIIINNLNLKLEKIKNNIESDNKKKFNHLTEKIEKSIIQINESNNHFNNESRVDVNANTISNEQINLIKSQINNQNKKLESIETKLNLELNKINELIFENEKKINLIQNMYENQKQNKESMKVEELSIERAKKINDENISNKTKEKNIINNSSNNNIENAQKSEEEINNNKEKRSNPEINSKKSSKKGSKISEINSIEDLLLD